MVVYITSYYKDSAFVEHEAFSTKELAMKYILSLPGDDWQQAERDDGIVSFLNKNGSGTGGYVGIEEKLLHEV